MKRVAVLYSGGKDSTYAIDLFKRNGFSVVCLITIFSDNMESYMLHTANIGLVGLSAQALEIPLVVGHTKGNKEEELNDISTAVLAAKEKFDFETLGCGGLASVYQKRRIEKIASDCNLDCMCPLWGINQKRYMKQLVESGYHFILTSVSAAGLDDSWLGKEINQETVMKLIDLSEKYGFNAALEGGEGETLVLDCPLFAKEKIQLTQYKKEWNGYQGLLKITKAELEKKPPLQI